MENEQGTRAPVPASCFPAGEHVVIGQDDHGTWHLVRSLSLELMGTACYARVVGGTPLRMPFAKIMLLSEVPPEAPEEGIIHAICPACAKNVISEVASRMRTLLAYFPHVAGVSAEVHRLRDASIEWMERFKFGPPEQQNAAVKAVGEAVAGIAAVRLDDPDPIPVDAIIGQGESALHTARLGERVAHMRVGGEDRTFAVQGWPADMDPTSMVASLTAEDRDRLGAMEPNDWLGTFDRDGRNVVIRRIA